MSKETGSTSGTSGEALAAICDAYDAHAFGVVSIHNQPMVEGLDVAKRYTAVRHEATCVSAADGFARVADTLGVAVTSTGTGAGNAAGSLVEALTAGSSVLHVTGNIDSEYLGLGRGVIHECKDQIGMLESVSKAAFSVFQADGVGDTLFDAAALARSAPAGPVSVEVPIDLQYETTKWSDPAPPANPPLPDAISLERAADLISRCERPLLWVGGGGVHAQAQIDALSTAIGAGVVTSNAGRGVIPETDDRVFGNFAATEGGAKLLAEADLLISIGTHFRSNETRHYKLVMPTEHIQIDIDDRSIGRVYPATVGLHGDAAAVLATVLDLLPPQPDRRVWVDTVREARTQVRQQLNEDLGPYSALCAAMREVLPDRSPLVRDVTIPASAWGNRLLDVLHPSTNVNARGGGIGQGLGMAIGAAHARRDVPTSLMVGDGGLALHVGELATVRDSDLWVVIIVFNDGGYGVLRNLQDHHFERRSGVDLYTPSFARLADAFDLDYRRLGDATDSTAVLQEAVDLQQPVLVEVDCVEFGPMKRPFVPPVPVNA